MNPTHINQVRPASRRRRAAGVVETPDYAAFARRIIRAHGRRVADGDIEALPELVALATELDSVITETITGLRGFGYSWAEIAARLGITRQAAHQKWGARNDA